MKVPRTNEEIERMVAFTRDILKAQQRRDRTIAEIMRLCSTLTESDRIDIVCGLLGIDFAKLYDMISLYKANERTELMLLGPPDLDALQRWADDGGAP